MQCSILLTYSVSLKSSLGEIITTNITSDECEGPARNMTCSTEFQILGHPDASYAVSIKSSYAWFYCVHTADFVDVVGK